MKTKQVTSHTSDFFHNLLEASKEIDFNTANKLADKGKENMNMILKHQQLADEHLKQYNEYDILYRKQRDLGNDKLADAYKELRSNHENLKNAHLNIAKLHYK